MNARDMNQLPLGVGIGRLLTFDYPERNLIETAPLWVTRTLLIESIVDTQRDPIDPLAIDCEPYRHRGRWLLTGVDLDLDRERSFYLESMRDFRADTWRQLGLYDPCESEPPFYRQGKYPPTRNGIDFMREVIQGFNDITEIRDLPHCVGIYTWNGQHGHVA